jgi:hypothetical protein
MDQPLASHIVQQFDAFILASLYAQRDAFGRRFPV